MTAIPEDMAAHNRAVIEEFRRNGGPPEGRPLLLLTTTGARTGLERTTPMMYVPDGDRLLVLAANAGAPRHPDWYHNLVAHPEVTVEHGGESYAARAVVLAGDERTRAFTGIVEKYPFFGEYEEKIPRRIPVIALVRDDAPK